jgi:hypothetical protein
MPAYLPVNPEAGQERREVDGERFAKPCRKKKRDIVVACGRHRHARGSLSIDAESVEVPGMQVALDEDGRLRPARELRNVLGMVSLGGRQGERLPEADEIKRILDDVLAEAVKREHPLP